MIDFVSLHPVVVHTPLALLVFSVLFELVGRATDSEWCRKTALALLVIGASGAVAAVLSGEQAEEVVSRAQRLDRDAIEAHENAGKLTMWVALGAVAARLIGLGMKRGVAPIALLALILQLAAAALVVRAGLFGGELVYRHGAGVRVNDAYVSPRPPGERPRP